MHEYYAANKDKFRKGMDQFLSLVAPELEKASGKKYEEVFEEIWAYYEKHPLERFPYVGGDKVSGTRNLTGAYYFVAMGEVMKRYGLAMEDIGHIMVYAYERNTLKMPGLVRALMGKVYRSPKLLNKLQSMTGSQDYRDASPLMRRSRACSFWVLVGISGGRGRKGRRRSFSIQ